MSALKRKSKAETMNPSHLAATPLPHKAGRIQRALRNLRDSKRLPMVIFVAFFAMAGISLLVVSRAATSVSSVRSGAWSDPATWAGGHVPEVGDVTTIETAHTVTFDMTTTPVLAETHIKGTLTFDPNKSTKLVTNRNILVTGRLVMKPANPNIEQFIQLVNIDETRFVGGGMDPVASDVGIWVTGAGVLDIAGSSKQSWTNVTGAAAAGATSITLKDAPAGWRAGDQIFITPTEPPTVGNASTQVEERTVSSVSGNTVTFSGGLGRNHPMVNNTWTAEVGNLTRNVRIEGTPTGSSHIFIRSSQPQNIAHAQLRYMSVAGRARFDEEAAPLLGRYAIHFHHNNDTSRGSVVDDVVVRDGGQHAFVPHSSHGIVMKNSIAYKTKGHAFWWDEHGMDPTSDSHQITWDRNLVANLDAWLTDNFRNTGFMLGAGHDNKVTNNVVAANQAGQESAGYVWDNDDIGVWVFDNNIAHNGAANGISVWQNSTHTHPIRGFALYHNREFGISHGAYANDYRYFNGFVYGNGKAGVELLANSHSQLHQRWENIIWDGAGITPTLVLAGHSSVDSNEPTLFINNTFRGYTKNAIELNNVGPAGDPRKVIDVINSTFDGPSPAIFFGPGGSDNPLNRVRVQPTTGQPYQIGPNNVRTNIGKFMPSFYGNGNGLLAEYFLGTDFSNKVFSRVEPSISDAYNDESNHKPMPWIKPWPTPFTVRWSGEFQAQETGSYTFIRDRYMGMRVWLNNQLILDGWNDSRSEVRSTPVTLTQGQKYPFRAEGNFTAGVDWQEFRLFVEGPSQPRLILPMSQLYCSNPICDINPPQSTTPSPSPSPSPPPPTPPSSPPADTTAPSVSVTAPSNNATVSGTVNVTANASDNVGVTQVEFLVDGQSRSTDTSSPYGFSLNTTNPSLSNGNHTIVARARDAAGNTGTSSAITITVNNSSPAPNPSPTPTPTPPPPPPAPTFLPEDINQDGRVNLLDFILLARKFGQQGSGLGRADINQDGRVNLLDFLRLASKFNQ